jgi:hypothetical protein
MAASMDAKMKACMTPHALTHLLTGAGVGLLVASFALNLATPMIAIIVIIAGVVIDLAVNKG